MIMLRSYIYCCYSDCPNHFRKAQLIQIKERQQQQPNLDDRCREKWWIVDATIYLNVTHTKYPNLNCQADHFDQISKWILKEKKTVRVTDHISLLCLCRLELVADFFFCVLFFIFVGYCFCLACWLGEVMCCVWTSKRMCAITQKYEQIADVDVKYEHKMRFALWRQWAAIAQERNWRWLWAEVEKGIIFVHIRCCFVAVVVNENVILIFPSQFVFFFFNFLFVVVVFVVRVSHRCVVCLDAMKTKWKIVVTRRRRRLHY